MADEMADEPTVVLIPLDTDKSTPKIEVRRAPMMISSVISTLFEDSDVEDEDNEIPLPAVTSDVLLRVINFCNRYHEEPFPKIKPPLRANKLSELVSDWYVEFMGVEPEMISKLIVAASYMGIDPLTNLLVGYVALEMKSSTPEEFKKKFKIKDEDETKTTGSEDEAKAGADSDPGDNVDMTAAEPETLTSVESSSGSGFGMGDGAVEEEDDVDVVMQKEEQKRKQEVVTSVA